MIREIDEVEVAEMAEAVGRIRMIDWGHKRVELQIMGEMIGEVVASSSWYLVRVPNRAARGALDESEPE